MKDLRSGKKMDYYLVTYDIKDSNRLQKVCKTMKNFGNHLQYSVFECYLNGINFVKMQDKLSKIIDEKEDRVIIIRLCPTCKSNILTMGNQQEYKEPSEPKIF